MQNNISKPFNISGRFHIINRRDVDTDMIFHNKYLHITDIARMGQYMFTDMPEYKNLPSLISDGDIVITGANFGCGSSRQQAVDGFISLGVRAIVGISFGAIYKRNAINAGLPLLECGGILDVDLTGVESIELDLLSGEICDSQSKRFLVRAEPMTQVQLDIYQAGGLLNLGR